MECKLIPQLSLGVVLFQDRQSPWRWRLNQGTSHSERHSGGTQYTLVAYFAQESYSLLFHFESNLQTITTNALLLTYPNFNI